MTKDLGLVPILLLTSTVMLLSDALWPVRRELWRRWRRVTSSDIWWHSPCVVELQQSSWTGTVYPIFSGFSHSSRDLGVGSTQAQRHQELG